MSVLDMKMPEMDGYEMAEHLQKDDALKDIPVIAITASALKQDEEVISKLCGGYLRKPICRSNLIREIMKHLPHTVVKTMEGVPLKEITPTEMRFPSSDAVKRLIQAANMGSVTEIKNCIADIKAMGRQYQPFVNKIDACLREYLFDEIVDFVQRGVDKEE